MRVAILKNKAHDMAESFVKNNICKHNESTKIMKCLREIDIFTYNHSISVAIIATTIAIQLGYKPKDIYYLTLGALFHDIGKLNVPQQILKKPKALTECEFKEIKKHPLYGLEILDHFNFPVQVSSTIVQHHERLDGSGYPLALKAEDIHLNAQIVSVADVFQALTSDRPYKQALKPKDSYEIIMTGVGTQFSPIIVRELGNLLDNN